MRAMAGTVVQQPGSGASDPEALVGRALADGRYQIVRLLGAGGMGAVYEALQVNMGRRVALKLVRPEHAGATEARVRFHQEMRAASLIEHPHTIRLYDF